MNISTEERFMRHVTVADSGCWEWTGGTDPTGYGRFHLDGRSPLAHRVAYEMWVEPIPAGRTVDHICRRRHCVNPDHLRTLGQSANVARRGVAPGCAQVPDAQHGTVTGYATYRCRCERCRTANREYQRAWRAGLSPATPTEPAGVNK